MSKLILLHTFPKREMVALDAARIKEIRIAQPEQWDDVYTIELHDSNEPLSISTLKALPELIAFINENR